MIACGYTLDVYCEREDEHNELNRGDGHFSGFTKTACIRAAKKRGWKLNRELTEAYCPKHAKDAK